MRTLFAVLSYNSQQFKRNKKQIYKSLNEDTTYEIRQRAGKDKK